jgi:hypothetical protein
MWRVDIYVALVGYKCERRRGPCSLFSVFVSRRFGRVGIFEEDRLWGFVSVHEAQAKTSLDVVRGQSTGLATLIEVTSS